MFAYLLFEIASWVIGLVALTLLFLHLAKHTAISTLIKRQGIYIPATILIFTLFVGLIANRTYPPDFAMPAFMRSHAPGGVSAALPFGKIVQFFLNKDNFEKVDDIGADPNAVPHEPQSPDTDGVVRISLTAQEVVSEIAPGIYFNFWTYNNQIPGPMLRVKEGDTIEVALTNDKTSLHNHNVDLHAVTGPGGGATLTNVAPGETKIFRWKALNPGLYVYHCATPNVSSHNSHGQYGLIMVDPKDEKLALPKVDKEFYVTQGEYYTIGQLGKKGLAPFDSEALLDGIPNYVIFNGRVENMPRMHAKVGDRIRMYVGNGGVNLISSFHVIGEVFDKVHPNGAIGEGSAIEKNTQTALVLPGGSSIVEFTVDVPGKFLLVDHALARMNKGAWAVLEVSGAEQKDIFSSVEKNP
ncbi:MAG TPA: nitrite reductase, copper-containing [Candidatus Jacksonbacteria bacterium]|nr:nitrite reductase, copper-containing [Candidatus Jacksonbacteria bacterium]